VPIEYRQVADSDAAAGAALELVLQRAAGAIARCGRFTLALCGGSTPQQVYGLLAASAQDWRRWHLIYGDERCLPGDDPERTSAMVQRIWLDKIQLPTDNHHVPAVELGADAAAADYAAVIEPLLPLDLALLGMGEDGHTASLFPGHSHPEEIVVPVHNAPKPPPDRISLSYATLCGAGTVCFLVTGPAKREALHRWLAGEDLPVARVTGSSDTILITDLPRSG
jgi:6-phosphogluconolactonase